GICFCLRRAHHSIPDGLGHAHRRALPARTRGASFPAVCRPPKAICPLAYGGLANFHRQGTPFSALSPLELASIASKGDDQSHGSAGTLCLHGVSPMIPFTCCFPHAGAAPE